MAEAIIFYFCDLYVFSSVELYLIHKTSWVQTEQEFEPALFKAMDSYVHMKLPIQVRTKKNKIRSHPQKVHGT